MNSAPRLAWEQLERELRGEAPQTWYKRMKSLDTNRFNQHRLLLDRFASGAELKTLFTMAHREEGSHQGFRQWRIQARRYSPSYRARTSRYRRTIHSGQHYEVLNYQAKGQPAQGGGPRPLLIGFTGNAGLLMAPTPYVLSALGSMGWDLLLVRRRTLEGYFDQQGDVLRSIIEYLDQHLRGLSRRGLHRSQVRSLGTSAGGLAALVVAQRLALGQGVAIGAGAGPDTFRPGGSVTQALSGFHSWWPRRRRTPLMLAYPEYNPDDRASAGWIASYFSHRHSGQTVVSGRAYRDCSHHTLFLDLVEAGVNLEQALPSLLRPPAGPDSMAEDDDPLARDVDAAQMCSELQSSTGCGRSK